MVAARPEYSSALCAPGAAQQGDLRARGVGKIYAAGNESIVALESCSLDIASRQFCALVGPSGCGKTTLLNAIAGFDALTSGEIELDGRIIACRSMWVTHLKVDDRVVLNRLPIDRAVLPEMQRHHVMSAMEARTPREWFDQFGVIVGLSTNWQSINFIAGIPHRRGIDVVARRLEGDVNAAAVGECTIRRVDAFDDRVDGLWRDASSEFRLVFVRSKESLNYRYADPRAGDYSIAIAEAGDRLLGYVVYASWLGTGQIADLLVLLGHDDVLVALLAQALDQLRQTGCASVECWRDIHHPYGSVLDKLGFDHARRRQGITVHWLRGPDDLTFFEQPTSAVHIMAGDTDLV